MLTYRIRPRTLRLLKEGAPAFPAKVTVRCHLLPLQTFGAGVDEGGTARRGSPASAYFNANTGQYHVESRPPLEPIDAIWESQAQRFTFAGAVLTHERTVSSLDELAGLIDSLYFVLPPLLCTQFEDPPIIDRIEGAIGDLPFRWELEEWKMAFDVTTTEEQEKRALECINYLFELIPTERRRVVAALHYFHVACRLDRVGAAPGEFLAEALLNYAKVLEVLFPPSGSGQTRDAVREALLGLGYDASEIDRDFLPSMALRNTIDVGHVDLSLFTSEQLVVLHRYVRRAKRGFRQLLQKVLSMVTAGTLTIAPWTREPLEARVVALVNRLRDSFDSLPPEEAG